MIINREVYHALRRSMGSEVLQDHLRKLFRKKLAADLHCNINARGHYGDILRKYAVNGKIGIHRSGMDCDHTQYSRSSIRDAHVGAWSFWKDEEQHQEYLDGPEYTRFDRPENVTPRSASRDLALEAYEEGRPSLIIPVSDAELYER